MQLRSNLISFYTLLRREFLRIIRIWPESLLPAVITMCLYFVIFGNIIGSRIGDMGEIPYITYIIPGLVMIALINNSYMNVEFSFYLSRFQRNIEELFISPMSNHTILLGYVSGGIVRGMLVGLIVLLISMLFSDIHIYSYAVTFLMAIATSTLLALAGFINGALAKNFDQLSIVPMFVLTPLTYLGGVFYSIQLLPLFWQKATYFNPIFYMVSGFRYGMLGVEDISIKYVLSVLFVCILVLYNINIWMLRKGVGVKS